jgi:hypothetical protein
MKRVCARPSPERNAAWWTRIATATSSNSASPVAAKAAPELNEVPYADHEEDHGA